MAFEPVAQFGEGNDDIDIADIARSVRRQWRLIAYVTGATTCFALYLVLFATPQFSQNGSLYFGDIPSQNATTDNSVNLLTNFQTLNDVPTQVALIQSRALVEQAILETGLNVTVEPEGQAPLTYWQWRFEHHESIDAYAPKAGDLVVLFATLFDPGSGGGVFTLKFGSGGAYSLLNADGDGKIILSGEFDQPAAGDGVTLLVKPSIGDQPPAPGSIYTVVITPAKLLAEQIIGGNLSVLQGGQTNSLTQTADINFLWNDPYKGQAFVNQLMKDFIATQLSWKTESASDTQQFVAQQLDNIKQSLSDADDKLASYKAQTGIVDVPANAQAVVSQLSQYEVQRASAILQQQALQQLVQSLNNPQPGFNPYLVTQASDPVLAQLAGNLATAEVQYRTQSLQFTPSSPELQTSEATIQRTKDAIRTLLQNDENLAAGNVSNLNNLIAKYNAQLKSMPAQSLQITELTRASDVFGQLYVLLMQDEEEAEVSKAATIVNTRVVSPAEVPLAATSPRGGITVLSGLILGLLFGTMLVLVRRVLSSKFHSEGDVRRLVHTPIFGLIPYRLVTGNSAASLTLRSNDSFSEAFRLLRARVFQLFTDDITKSRIILVTSVAARDGKTTVSVNLAKSLGDNGSRVLLIDGDLHRGHLHQALNIRQTPGLAELLSGRDSARPQPVPGQAFWALSAGGYVENPANILKQITLDLAFRIFRNDFDFIIIDCPPLPSVVDTITFAHFADLILSVIFLERTSRSAFTAHCDALQTISSPLGIVINGITGGPHYQDQAYANTKTKTSVWRRVIPWL